jgi:hypothetical protein
MADGFLGSCRLRGELLDLLTRARHDQQAYDSLDDLLAFDPQLTVDGMYYSPKAAQADYDSGPTVGEFMRGLEDMKGQPPKWRDLDDGRAACPTCSGAQRRQPPTAKPITACLNCPLHAGQGMPPGWPLGSSATHA